jgi:hypothetical protein
MHTRSPEQKWHVTAEAVRKLISLRVGSPTGEFDAISWLYVAEINAQKWGARVFTQPRPEAASHLDYFIFRLADSRLSSVR